MSGKKTEILKYKAPDGNHIRFPVATIEGTQDGPHFVITAGIHGCEYPAIVSSIDFFKKTDPADVNGTITIVTVGSMDAFEQRNPFVSPADKVNPNRVFPGKADGTYTDVLVYHLFNDIIKGTDYHLDVHGGDLVEYLDPFSMYHNGPDKAVNEKSKEMAEYYGFANVIETYGNGAWSDKGTNYANSSEHGIPSAIVEAGNTGLLEPEFVELHVRGIENVLRHFGVLAGEADKPGAIRYYKDFKWLYSPVRGIYRRMVEVGAEVTEGQPLGVIENVFGEKLVDISATATGRVVFLTANPSIADNGLLMGIAQS